MVPNIADIIDTEEHKKSVSDFSRTLGINISIINLDGKTILPENPEYNCVLNGKVSEDYSERCLCFEESAIKRVLSTKSCIIIPCLQSDFIKTSVKISR